MKIRLISEILRFQGDLHPLSALALAFSKAVSIIRLYCLLNLSYIMGSQYELPAIGRHPFATELDPILVVVKCLR
jgi:hypothetical protein